MNPELMLIHVAEGERKGRAGQGQGSGWTGLEIIFTHMPCKLSSHR